LNLPPVVTGIRLVALEGGLVHHARLGAGPFLIAQSKNVQTQQQKARNCMNYRKLLQ
jgi:hypothetical protein